MMEAWLLSPSPVFCSLHTGSHFPMDTWDPSHPFTHRDGVIVLHVLPHDSVSYHFIVPAPLPQLDSIQVPPDHLQDTDDPESCEQEGYEDQTVENGWEGKQEH